MRRNSPGKGGVVTADQVGGAVFVVCGDTVEQIVVEVTHEGVRHHACAHKDKHTHAHTHKDTQTHTCTCTCRYIQSHTRTYTTHTHSLKYTLATNAGGSSEDEDEEDQEGWRRNSCRCEELAVCKCASVRKLFSM